MHGFEYHSNLNVVLNDEKHESLILPWTLLPICYILLLPKDNDITLMYYQACLIKANPDFVIWLMTSVG